MTTNTSFKSSFLWIALLVTVIAIPISLLILYALGQTSGVEFSPDDFSRRSFSYNQTPLVGWTIRKKVYSDQTTPLEEFLVFDGLISPVINRTKVWHLISDSGSSSEYASAECDARFLTNYLDLTNDEGDDYWTIWTEKYPKSAKVFWPRVAELARQEMYLKAPDLMQFAMELEKDDVSKFTNSLDQLMAEIYLELGELDFELKRFARAKIRLRRSNAIHPTQTARELLEKIESNPAARLSADDETGSEDGE